jgi:hypothetical protein
MRQRSTQLTHTRVVVGGQALLCPSAARRSFDLASHPENVGRRFKTLTALLATFAPGGASNCDYASPELPLTTLVDPDDGARESA